MTLTRIQSRFTYRSVQGTVTYTFDVVVDEQSVITVENVTRQDSFGVKSCDLPSVIFEDVQDAVDLVQDLVAETQVASGTITFTGQTTITEAIAPGTLNNTEYRVVYTPPDSIPFRTENKATTSFDADAGSAYGSPTDPKDVDYVVLVSTAQSSSYGGSLTFVQADAGTKSVTFPAAFESADYRVVLTPDDFFDARVISKTTSGFTVEILLTLGAADTVDVGFDVFVG